MARHYPLKRGLRTQAQGLIPSITVHRRCRRGVMVESLRVQIGRNIVQIVASRVV